MKRFVFLIIIVGVICGCAAAPKTPLDILYYRSSDPMQSRNLIVFLKGRGASYHSFERYGFVEAVRRRNLPYDMAVPDAHYGYYISRSLFERLREDIIEPARNRGYEKIWLVGISMGGLGSVLYLKEKTADVDGIIIIAPFLGYGGITKEITNAGGLEAWQPGSYDESGDWQRMLWHWLQEYAGRIDQMPPIFLGYGGNDTYVGGQELLSTVLPASQVLKITGGHDLQTFQQIWNLYLDRKVLQ